jgi:hypothetical protein
MPSGLQSLATRLSNYFVANFDSHITIPVQLALWRGQGETIADILSTFDLTEEDWAVSSTILGMPNETPVRIVPGTYSYSSRYTVTITDTNFTMNYGGRNYSGNYMVIGNILVLKTTSAGSFVFTVVNNALRDREGDLWRRQ